MGKSPRGAPLRLGSAFQNTKVLLFFEYKYALFNCKERANFLLALIKLICYISLFVKFPAACSGGPSDEEKRTGRWVALSRKDEKRCASISIRNS
jgi:hypothetical protein